MYYRSGTYVRVLYSSVYRCIRTPRQLHNLMFDPVRSRRLRPPTQRLPPRPAHRAQHIERSTLGTPDTVTIIVTGTHHQERPYQHHLQHL